MQFGHLNYILFSTHESFGHLAAEHQKRAISQRGGGGLKNKHLHKKIIIAKQKRQTQKTLVITSQISIHRRLPSIVSLTKSLQFLFILYEIGV